MSRRHAEVAGAGIAGLTVAAALGQRGWSVTVHERDPEIRAFGAGIFIYENGLRVLEAIGAYDEAVAGSELLCKRETRDRNNRTVSVAYLNRRADERVVSIVRQQLLTALRTAAERAGAEIVTGSRALAADPDGLLHLSDGRSRRADLVIAADGVHSQVRESLGLLRLRKKLPDGGIRVLIPRLPEDVDPEGAVCHEHWSGARRVVSVPCDRERIYIGLAARVSDEAANATPVNKEAWRQSFPHLGSLIERIGPEARWDRFELVKLRAWSSGRVAILGDAAHAQPPNLGQGAGCSMMCALGLAVALAENSEILTALQQWERRERPIVDHTQRVSMLYGALTVWPPYLRAAALGVMHRWGWLNRQRLKTARHMPTGALQPRLQ